MEIANNKGEYSKLLTQKHLENFEIYQKVDYKIEKN